MSFISNDKAMLLVNAYILSPFNYCPLIWMFCGKEAHNLIPKCYHKASCVLSNSDDKDFENLLLEFNSISIHARNLRLMVTEAYKSLNHIGPKIMEDMFIERNSNYKLRSGHTLELLNKRKYI